ncbi:uncharacterized protein BDR25DRAFT_361080 [Lindgomyces ingoldianus]|uniref:Uncharacterized protein n=1 Tax=Lindgomyces ingoldianus TaxID=673940 RepID=A0ACB6QDC3_9PLEO|nr:uncharacterized protein BDR25DRAFT_361080 [Lindgomyces ingoldianus]KAF2464850.1 hypothetical protein BDR25DRAFT_361080 [Lindgomyces ingoldianus]
MARLAATTVMSPAAEIIGNWLPETQYDQNPAINMVILDGVLAPPVSGLANQSDFNPLHDRKKQIHYLFLSTLKQLPYLKVESSMSYPNLTFRKPTSQPADISSIKSTLFDPSTIFVVSGYTQRSSLHPRCSHCSGDKFNRHKLSVLLKRQGFLVL